MLRTQAILSRRVQIGIIPPEETSTMNPYAIPQVRKPLKLKKKQIQLIANGDLRTTANQKCWPEQEKMEHALRDAVAAEGYELLRAHPFKEADGHGFIGSQKEGLAVFANVDP